jgi:hypothetical protein
MCSLQCHCWNWGTPVPSCLLGPNLYLSKKPFLSLWQMWKCLSLNNYVTVWIHCWTDPSHDYMSLKPFLLVPFLKENVMLLLWLVLLLVVYINLTIFNGFLLLKVKQSEIQASWKQAFQYLNLGFMENFTLLLI